MRISAVLLVSVTLVFCQIQAVAQTYKLFWPPQVGMPYPGLELSDVQGKKVRLSNYKGKVLLIEPIGMSCPACQAFAGGDTLGGLNGVVPQGGLPSIETTLRQNGVDPSDPRLMRVQLLLYGPGMAAPTQAEAQSWAKHFHFGSRPNELILIADKRFQNDQSYNMIPGFQLVDKNFVLRSDASGHNPKDDLYRRLLPMVKTLF